jgi:hypothetical protein
VAGRHGQPGLSIDVVNADHVGDEQRVEAAEPLK